MRVLEIKVLLLGIKQANQHRCKHIRRLGENRTFHIDIFSPLL